jgi:hypothetical protein
MNDEEQSTSIGKLMLQWKTSNERLAALDAEFMRHGETFRSLSSLLRRARRVNGERNVLGSRALDEGCAQ